MCAKKISYDKKVMDLYTEGLPENKRKNKKLLQELSLTYAYMLFSENFLHHNTRYDILKLVHLN